MAMHRKGRFIADEVCDELVFIFAIVEGDNISIRMGCLVAGNCVGRLGDSDDKEIAKVVKMRERRADSRNGVPTSNIILAEGLGRRV